MKGSGGNRLRWDEVPASVVEQVTAALGSPVISVDNQPGGFSPGVAARCGLDDGRRVFIKAVSSAQNVQACRMHRREIEVSSQLPPWAPAPRLQAVHDDGDWVVLVFDEIAGRQPPEPWTIDTLDVVVPALLRHGATLDPTPVPGLPTVVQRHRAIFDGWRRLAAGDGDAGSYGDRVGAAIGDLAAIEEHWEDAATGGALLHADLRADNLLLGDDGTVTLVDWPHACTGAGFVDLVWMLPSIAMGGGPDPATVIDRYDLDRDVDAERLDAVAAAFLGFLVRHSLDEPPPGLPALRAFQRAQATPVLDWLIDRVSSRLG